MISDLEITRLLWDTFPDTIHGSDDTIYLMRPDFTLAYVNLGWTHFAARNGGEPAISLNWPIGSYVLAATAPVLRPFFAENFSKCLRERRPWEHYECSSADLYRSFVMRTFPVGAGEGLLVVHSLAQETLHTRCVCEPRDILYRDQHGFILQCAHCRRVKRCGAKPTWDWVRDWVTSCPTNTSHGLCEPCYGFYYRNSRLPAKRFPEPFRTGE
jgi:hypothetical protein